ncbi:MAG TPA: hypothetical protein VN228_01600 [Pyrinomonadaceae bacterium]|nr:hypothetical protein [Pyrinomonadaceae bacterium]
MEPLTLTFVTVMFTIAFYLVVSIRNDLRKKGEAGRRQRFPARRTRRR